MIHCTQVAFRKGRVTRQSLIIAPNSGINTFTQVLASAHLASCPPRVLLASSSALATLFSFCMKEIALSLGVAQTQAGGRCLASKLIAKGTWCGAGVATAGYPATPRVGRMIGAGCYPRLLLARKAENWRRPILFDL